MRLVRIILIVCCLSPVSTFAGESGRFAYGVSLLNLSVNDPDGAVSNTTDGGFLHLFYIDDLWRDARYYTELYYLTSSIDAKGNTIGQSLSATGLRAVYQHRLRWTRNFKPWFGVGANLYRGEYTRRYTVDSAGFLLDRYPDRSTTTVALTVDALNEWRLTERLDLGLRALYSHPFGSGIKELSVTTMLIYKGF